MPEGAQDSFCAKAGWVLVRPHVPYNGKTIVLPTVHTQGDQRILRCMQTALNCGYAIHIIWLGERAGTDHWDPLVSETRLSKPRSVWSRLNKCPRVALVGWRSLGAAWYIHDYYMLPFALIWTCLTGRPAIYDVHEYYGHLYGQKFPKFVRRWAIEGIDSFQALVASRLGGVNVVAPEMSELFACRSIPVSVTPNYPSKTNYGSSLVELSSDSFRAVIHTGTLTKSYGSNVLVDIASLLHEHDSDITVTAIAKFPSQAAIDDFDSYYTRAGKPPNLELISPVPSHEIPNLLKRFDVGLSLLQRGGQNSLAVPSKLYEYLIMGLAVVASDLPAQTNFLVNESVARVVEPQDAAGYVRCLMELRWQAPVTDVRRLQSATNARRSYVWEEECEPRLKSLIVGAVENNFVAGA